MQDTLFWHNCEVLRVSAPASPGEPVCVVMSAAAVERVSPEAGGPAPGDGATGQAKLSGFIQPLTLRFHGARLDGSPLADCIGVIAQGELRALSPSPSKSAGAPGMWRQVSLPWHHTGGLSLSLSWRNGSQLLIEAESADALPDPGARFIESYAC